MQLPEPIPIVFFFLGLLVALGLSVLLMAWIMEQYRRGRDLLPYQPHRPVPWQGFHVMLLGVLFIVAPSLVYGLLEVTGAASVILDAGKIASPPDCFCPEAKQANSEPTPHAFFGQEQPDSHPEGSSEGPPESKSPALSPRLEPAQKGPNQLRDVQTEEDMGHQIEQLLRQKQDVWIWVLVVVMAVGVAPVIEEWMFRAILQGWLEKLERNILRWLRGIYRVRAIRAEGANSLSPRVFISGRFGKFLGMGPVVISSLLFAGLHYRVAGPTPPAHELLMLLICQGLGNLLSFLVGIGFLRISCGARAADFGWSCQNLSTDIFRGLVAYLLVLGPVYALMILTKIVWMLFDWEQIAPDPIPLFFLSLVLGLLYFRTHRFVPCLVLHTTFNATGLCVFWLFS